MYSFYRSVDIPEMNMSVGTGWLPPLPDLRDYSDDTPQIADIAKKIGLTRRGKNVPSAPAKVDLEKWCSPVENQGKIGSCSAHAAVGIIEYFENRAYRRHIDGSRLFVYKATRNLMGVTGDTGAWLRNAMGALALCGVPPEKYWPYTDGEAGFDKEPTAFVYSVADNYEALRYFCHDPQGQNVATKKVLEKVKRYLASGVPSMFGFYGFPTFGKSDVPGGIPFPAEGEQAQWGHAVVAVGYDDKMKITNLATNKATTGALKIRNSWGGGWGTNGYGWLPYDYVLHRFASDFWSLVRMEWIDTKQFGL